MKHLMAMLLSVALLSGCDISINKPTPKVLASDPGTQQQQQDVVDATATFLHLLDNGKADETWSTLSPFLQANMSEFVWVNTLKASRLGLGSFKERGPAAIGFSQQMPDAPPGNYAVVECQTRFSASKIKEKVILLEDGKQWRVIGYFVNKTFTLGDDDKKVL